MARSKSTLDEVQAGLLDRLRASIAPDDGDLAFERHQLLAIRFHQAARLNQPASEGEGRGWIRYFREHFPRGDEHAELLWECWRLPLVKDQSTGPGVLLAHGHPDAHWLEAREGGRPRGLVVNLENMWDDYEESVRHFIDSCRADHHRAKITLQRWAERAWTVELVAVVNPRQFSLDAARVSAAPGSRSFEVGGFRVARAARRR
jgi:hypothetical protein